MILNKNTVGSSLISLFFCFDISTISISRLGSNQVAGRFLNTFISFSDLSCRTERLYNEPAADAYSCYLSFLLYVYPPSLVLLYYSNIIFQAYCAKPWTLTRYCVFFVSFHRQRWCSAHEWSAVWIRFSSNMNYALQFFKRNAFFRFLSIFITIVDISRYFFLLQLLIDIKWKIVVLFIW